MANTLEAVVPRILAQGLVALRQNAVMARLVNRSFDKDAQMRGASVDVPIPSSMGPADDVVAASTYGSINTTPLTPTFVPVTLSNWKQKNFTMTDSDIEEVMAGYFNIQITEAAKSIANAIDQDILNLYLGVWGTAGVAGSTPFQFESLTSTAPASYLGLGAARDARKTLNKQLSPQSDRRIVLDVDAEANASALPQFVNAFASGTTDLIKEGVIGKKLGFDWYMNQNILSHTTVGAGTITTTGASGGANTQGSAVLAVTGCTTAPAAGDVFTIAGDDQNYVALAGCTTTSWNIAPGLRYAFADSSSVTFVPSHVVNLAFHKDAFALAVRPLLDIDPLGNRIETFTDDISGLTMRLEVSRQFKQTTFCFDILYGVALVRPELACRILG